MATIYVGSARRDENGKYVNGVAGDSLQKSSVNDTVGEVSMQVMYAHSKGWYILRPKNIAHAGLIASKMTTACNNKNIGYDQNGRYGINACGVSTTTPTECDCSSLVRQVVKEATGKDPGDFTTFNEADVLEATGLFEKRIAYVSQEKTPVYNGDILVTKTKGHTVVVVSGNPREVSSSTSSSSTKKYMYNGVDYSLVFNPTYYSNKYADLKKAFDTDDDKLFNHFIKYGMKEARQACDKFNVAAYKHRYTDLQKAFGDDLPSYYKHYVKYGYKEGRNALPATTAEILYRVQIGSYTVKDNAERLLADAKQKGCTDAFINFSDKKYHKVQVGAYSVKSNAEMRLVEMKKLGYTNAFITT